MLSLADNGGFLNAPFRSAEGERYVSDCEKRNNGTYTLSNCRAVFQAPSTPRAPPIQFPDLTDDEALVLQHSASTTRKTLNTFAERL